MFELDWDSAKEEKKITTSSQLEDCSETQPSFRCSGIIPNHSAANSDKLDRFDGAGLSFFTRLVKERCRPSAAVM